MTSITNDVVYLDDFARANFPAANATSDFTPIVAAALASFDHTLDAGAVFNSPGGTLFFGPGPGNAPLTNGVYNFQTAAIPTTPQGFGIEVNRVVRLVGNNPSRTVLNFALGLGGIRVNSQGFPLNRDGSQSGLLGAHGSSIENMTLYGNYGAMLAGLASRSATGPTNSPCMGIFANAHLQVSNCGVHQFPGDGIHVEGAPDGTSADFDVIQFTDSSGHGGAAVLIQGHDANGVMVLQTSMRQSYYGIYENSLTGAVIVGGQFEACYVDIWANDPSGTPCFLGVYKESGEPVVMSGNCSVFGGVLAAELAANPSLNTGSGRPTIIAGGGGFSWLATGAQTGTGALTLGGPGANSDYFLTLSDLRELNGVWPFRLKSFPQGGLGFDYAATGISFLDLINSRNLVANGYVADAGTIPEFGYGGVGMRGMLLRSDYDGIFMGVARAKPASTAYPVGSVFRNVYATNPGDPTEWILVRSNGVLQWIVGGVIPGGAGGSGGVAPGTPPILTK